MHPDPRVRIGAAIEQQADRVGLSRPGGGHQHGFAVTNPPFHSSEAFLSRGLQLLDEGRLAGLVLLLRHDHLQADGRVKALNRVTREVHWRPVIVLSRSAIRAG